MVKKSTPRKTGPDAPEPAAFRVVSPLRHDGARYQPGETVLLDPETEAPTLIRLGVVEPIPEAAPAGPPSETPAA